DSPVVISALKQQVLCTIATFRDISIFSCNGQTSRSNAMIAFIFSKPLPLTSGSRTIELITYRFIIKADQINIFLVGVVIYESYNGSSGYGTSLFNFNAYILTFCTSFNLWNFGILLHQEAVCLGTVVETFESFSVHLDTCS